MAKKPIERQPKAQRRVVLSNLKSKEIDININITVDNSKNLPPNKIKESRVKIITKLSVTQLAYFFRVLYLMKKIKASSQTDIMRFIAETFETDHVSDISSKSLRSKYYKVQDNEKAATRKQLMEIIEFIDNDRR